MAFPVSPTNGQIAIVNGIAYQYASTNFSWTRILSSANIISANIISANTLTINNAFNAPSFSATGNITGNYFIGNGSLLTGISTGSSSNISNGTSNVTVVSSGGNVTVGVGGTGNVAVFATTGEYVTGIISASGNVTGGNILTAGLVSATGNIIGNYFIGNGSALTGIIAGGTTTFGNTAPVSPAVGDVWIQANTAIQYVYFNDSTSNQWAEMEAAQSFSTGSATTNPSGANTQIQFNDGGSFGASANLTFNNSSNTLSTSTINVSGNITGGNILTAGIVSATGNITGNVFIGNGSQLTGVLLSWSIANSNATMSTNRGYFVDTSGGAKTMTLPASFTIGDTVRINDLAGTFGTNNLTVARNGSNIQGVAQDLLVTVNQSSFGLVYSNSTYGWKLLEL